MQSSELEATNFSSGKMTTEQLEVLDPEIGDTVATLDAGEVAGLRDQLAQRGRRVDSLRRVEVAEQVLE